jgi:hypothetical protein
MTSLELLITQTQAEYPKLELREKSSSALMKVINVCLLVITFGRMKTFMTSFTTTVGYVVYTPSLWGGWSEKAKLMILRHERVHMRQRKAKGSFWFSISYLLLPFPILWAYYRMKYEMEAYEETLKAKWEYYGIRGFTPEAREAMISRFTGPSYFWTWPWRKRIEAWYDELVSHFVDA